MKVVKKMKNILLICGSGASSGFMAAAIRKAAKKENLNSQSKRLVNRNWTIALMQLTTYLLVRICLIC